MRVEHRPEQRGAGPGVAAYEQSGPLSLVEQLHYFALIGRELP